VTDEVFDVEALLASASHRSLEVAVCARGDLVERHIALVREMAAVDAMDSGSIAGNPDLVRIAEAIKAVEDEQAACTLTLTVKSVPRKAWVDCLAKHPPRKGVDPLDFNVESFPPAAVALCCDAISEDQAKRLNESLPQGEWDKVWNTVVQLNLLGTPHPKLRTATELARANGNS
jgi:hypothetical protein